MKDDKDLLIIATCNGLERYINDVESIVKFTNCTMTKRQATLLLDDLRVFTKAVKDSADKLDVDFKF